MDTNSLYQVNLFGDFGDIAATPDTTMRIMELLKGKGFNYLPSTFQEFTPVNPMPITRLRFSAPKNEIVVSIGSQRIAVDKHPLDPKGSNMGDITNFSHTASTVLGLLLTEYNKKGTRVSLVTNGFLREMSNDDLNRVYIKFVKPLQFYSDTDPIEWNVRSVSRINYSIAGTDETVNVVTSLGRVQGRMLANNMFVDFDRIFLEFDINTIPENKNARLSESQISDFLTQAIASRTELISQVERLIYA